MQQRGQVARVTDRLHHRFGCRLRPVEIVASELNEESNDDIEAATAEDIEKMKVLVEEAMEAGAEDKIYAFACLEDLDQFQSHVSQTEASGLTVDRAPDAGSGLQRLERRAIAGVV